jgi:hypothetical protein
MSSVTDFDLDATVRPRRIAALTAASILTAKQGQFQTIDDATTIVSDVGGGAHAVRVRCKPVGLQGGPDPNSLLTILVRVAEARTITKPTTAAAGTIVSAVLDGSDGSDLCVVMLPDAEGRVDLSVTLDAADATARVSLMHRHFCATTPVAIT